MKKPARGKPGPAKTLEEQLRESDGLRNIVLKHLLLNVDDLAVGLLKGHLILEELMTEVIKRSVRHEQFVKMAGLRFMQKLWMARSFASGRGDQRYWKLIEVINELRNDLAHSIETKNRPARMKKLKDVFFEILADMIPSDPDLHAQSNDRAVVTHAIVSCIGFIGEIEGELAVLRDMLGGLKQNAADKRDAKPGIFERVRKDQDSVRKPSK